ncbi:ATP-binding cassette domain-containing protein [Salinisphaera hydrothermalis]|uniref:ABC transporter ATP-binding protein n=1 Tax=Salinisphaera hydrothermalis (strain C41B8) TaxID=1304275 RepID=A0A084IIT9_SALHC|nr:ATP-binding cassette domain-containing protein [Salinisphaera hydrothermalis]KEZ76623.1 ABC transporter ATP-binding protein [Salinisphaera hydrothermalis C41B8]
MFEVNDCRFEVQGRCLLEASDLRFEEGKVYGLIGHNGSGKSTLLKLLARQQCASCGEICLNGRAVDHWGPREFARNVAYLPQHLPSAASLTVRELVTFGRYPWHGLLGRMSKQDKAQIDRAMTLTDTTEFAERMVDTLSGGERQRVWLAMLLAQGSRFLLLDEPLSALDIAHQVDTLSLIRNLCRDLGIGVIIVLHDVNMVSRYCDQLVALRDGRLLAQGTPDELMNDATLEAIYGIRMNVMPHPTDHRPIAVVQ